MDDKLRKKAAASAAARWRNQYAPDGDWSKTRPTFSERIGERPTKEQVYYQLVSLGPQPSPEDVDRIIGNSYWTDPIDPVTEHNHSPTRSGALKV